MSETIDRFKARLQRFEVAFFKGPEAATYSLDEHASVIDALERGDVDGAARAVDANWQRGLDRLTLCWDSVPSRTRWVKATICLSVCLFHDPMGGCVSCSE